MRRLLLDTHVLLWWLADDAELLSTARAAIVDADTVAVSAASAWEIAVKKQAGKLKAPDDLAEQVRRHAFEPLSVTVEHAERAGALELHHRDPFDRMLVAQAQLEQLTIVTRDPNIAHYDVPVLTA